MSTLQTLKTFIHQRLAVAVDEILGLVETTVQNYEEEIQQQKKIIESERAQNMVNNSNRTDSEQAMRFRVIIGEEVKKITFENGLPFCVNDFTQVVKQAFSLGDNIRLHYKDSDFDDFFTLTSTRDLKDKDTLKVIQLSKHHARTFTPAQSFTDAQSFTNAQNFTPGLSEVSSIDEIPSIELPDLPPVDEEETLRLNSKEQLDWNLDLQDCSSQSSAVAPSSNTQTPSDALNDSPLLDSSSSFVTARKLWTGIFEIPTFSYTTELALKKANEKFRRDGVFITPEALKPIKSDILERIAEAMYMYTAYPKDTQRMIVCQALIKKYPCLRERGSLSGCDGWNNSLMYKFGNYRTKLRNSGNQEVLINSLKHKPDGHKYPAHVKKPRKSEVNFLPSLPFGETTSSMEELRERLVSLHQSGASPQLINQLMSRTYSYRRQEVVIGNKKVEELKERWPALFTPVQINEEFKRCNTVPLQSSFMSNLDKFIPKLLTLFSAVGGALGQRLKSLWLELVQDSTSSALKKRDVVLRCLIEYMGDRVHDLISEHSGVSEREAADQLSSDSLKIYVCSEPAAVGVVIEGTVVLRGLDSLSSACCLLLGLLYALNIDYPPALFKTLDLFQRLLVGLDSVTSRNSSKLISLKNKLLNIS